MATKEIKKPKMVKIRIPYVKGESRDQFVALNGKSYLIQKGKEVEVPEGVAYILKRREDMLLAAAEYEESLSKASSPEG